MSLHIYKASAGSGKTYSLTRAYLELCFKSKNPNYFQRILAITFTNKAMAEMKQRIMNELFLLKTAPEKADHFKFLSGKFHYDTQQIQQQAKEILSAIIKNYDRFSISTIDAFLQRVLRVFAREMNFDTGYELELDQESAIDKIVESYIQSIKVNDPETGKLLQLVQENIDNNKSWYISKDLKEKVGKMMIEGWPYQAKKPWELDALKESLILGKTKAKKEIKQGLDWLQQAYRAVNSKGVYHHLRKLIEKIGKVDFEVSLEKIFEYSEKEVDKLLLKAGMEDNSCIAFVEEFKARFTDLTPAFRFYNSAVVALKSFAHIQLSTTLMQKVKTYQANNNVLLMSETISLLEQIVENTDVPFFYEKLGQQYLHLFIDEFQDTSRSQWNSIKPLVDNSLTQENDCFLIGDVKQSIYRWRGGDWNLLKSEAKNEFSAYTTEENNLEYNYRSAPEIVEFNNFLYQKILSSAAEVATDKNFKLLQDSIFQLSNEIYADAAQLVGGDKMEEGKVKVVDLSSLNGRDDGEEREANTKKLLLQEIKAVNEKGIEWSQMAILTRTGDELKLVAHWLKSEDIPFVSPESLLLNGSGVIKAIIAFWRWQLSPKDRVAFWEFYSRIKQEPQINISSWEETASQFNQFAKEIEHQSLLEQCMSIYQLIFDQKSPQEWNYLLSFCDLVMDFARKNGANLQGFISHWDAKKDKLSIALPEDIDAVKIMTIHKSKGLQFEATFLPFVNWKFVNLGKGEITASSAIKPFDSLKTWQLGFQKALAHTVFHEEFKSEYIYSAVDAINTLYVATTRAKKYLFLICGNQIGKAVNQCLSFNDFTCDEYTFGLFESASNISIIKEVKERKVNVVKPTTQELRKSIPEVHALPGNYGIDQRESLSVTREGVVIHELMESLGSSPSLPLDLSVYKGLLTHKELEGWQGYLEKWFVDDYWKPWLNPEGEIFREREIIGPDGFNHRPDCVVIQPQKTLVIDYKTGAKKEHHKTQMEVYIQLLSQMGYEKVVGKLLYLNPKQYPTPQMEEVTL